MKAHRTAMLSGVIAAVLVANVVALTTRPDGPIIPGARPDSSVTPSPGSGTKGRPGSSTSGTRRILPPAPGTYEYRTQVSTMSSSQETAPQQDSVTTYTFQRADKQGASYLQVVKVGAGKSASQRSNRWSPDGLYRVRDTTSDGPCTFDPPRLAIKFPIRVGQSWRLGVRECREPAASRGYRLTGHETVTVTRSDILTVGAEEVECFVVESVSSSTVTTPDGKSISDTKTVQWFSPKYGLFLRVQQITNTEVQPKEGGTERTTLRAIIELLSLPPS